VNFGLLFREQNLSTTDISHTFCRSVTKIWQRWGLANRNSFPEFREFCSGSPVRRQLHRGNGNIRPSTSQGTGARV